MILFVLPIGLAYRSLSETCIGWDCPLRSKIHKKSLLQEQIRKHVKRRGKKRAIIAIARMILTAIYNMLLTGEVWNPCDLFKIDMPDKLKAKQEEKAVKQAVKFPEKR